MQKTTTTPTSVSVDPKQGFKNSGKPGPDRVFTTNIKGISAKGMYWSVEPEGKSVLLTSDQVACMAAVSKSFDGEERIRSAYGWNPEYIRSILKRLADIGVIAEKGSNGETGKISLTKSGFAAIESSRSMTALFDECCAWLDAQAPGK